MVDPKASAVKPAEPFQAPQSQGRQTTRTTSSEARGEVVPARDFVDSASTQLCRLLSSEESERLLGVETLIAMAQTMVEQSGNPARFDARRWLSSWLAQPLPALAGATPASYMGTFEGRKLVAEILSMSQSGAYA